MSKIRLLSVLFLGVACTLLPGAAERHVVVIQQMTYSPSSINVKVGDSVTWTNRDDREHAITAEDGSFASAKIAPGESFSHTFTRPGSYPYGCKFHPREKGSVTVAD